MEQIIFWRGAPERIRIDNGPEFLSADLVDWCNQNHIQLKYIQLGKPVQNAYVERFNKTFREDILDAYVFLDLSQVRKLSNEWQEDYNRFHPHQSLNNKSPYDVLKKDKDQNNRKSNANIE